MLRILIIDDEPYIREGIAGKIEQSEESQWLVDGGVGNGHEAIEFLKLHHIDICLTDIRMPLMDGMQLVNTLKSIYPHIQWIFITSYNDFEYAKKAIQLGVHQYILKPVDRQTLYESLKSTSTFIYQQRNDLAHHLLIEGLQELQVLLYQWNDLILTLQKDKYPMLVIETLEVFEKWVKGNDYLLDALSIEFINLVSKKMKIPEDVMLKMKLPIYMDAYAAPIALAQARLYFRLFAISRMERCILYFFEHLRNGGNFQNKRMINQIKQYLDQHFAEKFTVEELAEQIPMSSSHLMTLFKQSTGKTVWSYLMEVRMHKAKLLLLDQKLKVYEIANQVGYENGEHFTRLFKDYFGVTPKEYRKRLDFISES
jgi:two-component system response regulator YesN